MKPIDYISYISILLLMALGLFISVIKFDGGAIFIGTAILMGSLVISAAIRSSKIER